MRGPGNAALGASTLLHAGAAVLLLHAEAPAPSPANEMIMVELVAFAAASEPAALDGQTDTAAPPQGQVVPPLPAADAAAPEPEPPLSEPPLPDAPALETPPLETPALETPVLETPVLNAPIPEPAALEPAAPHSPTEAPAPEPAAAAEPAPPPQPVSSRPRPASRPAPPPMPAAAPRTEPLSAQPAAASAESGAALAPSTVAAPVLAAATPTLAAAAAAPPLILDPRFRVTPLPPRYPPRARELDQQGEVLIRALIDERGAPGEIRIWRSSGYPLLDRAAEQAVRSWAFEPALRDNRPVQAWVQVPVRFRIH